MIAWLTVLGATLSTVKWKSSAFVAVLAVIPIWFSPVVGGEGIYAGVACAIVLIFISPTRITEIRLDPILIIALAAFAATILVGAFISSSYFALRTPLVMWAVPFIAGVKASASFGPKPILRAIKLTSVALAIAAIVEVRTGTPIASYFNVIDTSAASLANVQYRSNLLRAEVTWGHGIVLSGVLAAGLYAWLLQKNRLALLAVPVIAYGILLTASRAGYIALLLVPACWVVWRTAGDAARRGYGLVVLVAIGFLSVPLANLNSFDTTDFAQSNQYRSQVVSTALRASSVMGLSPKASFGSVGLEVEGLKYIDSTLLQAALLFGLSGAACLTLVYLAVVIAYLRYASPLSAMAVIQIPSLIFSGFLGQHQMFFWFVVGASLVATAPPLVSDERSEFLRRGESGATGIRDRGDASVTR